MILLYFRPLYITLALHFRRGGQRFAINCFRQFPKRNVNEIKHMEEGLDEEQFDVCLGYM